ncbi:MAG: histidine phosphatase family protein [Burkholderiaceae bacterium]
MGTILVVRHGQAAFGTDDYDRLTEQGFEQSRLLGRYLAHRGLAFDAVVTGTLRRHIETADTILEALGASSTEAQHGHERRPGLNEYDPQALVMALTGQPVGQSEGAARRDPVVVREHFRLLRDALLAWTEGRTRPEGMPDWNAFQAGAVDALVWARERFSDGNVLVVSSGGPIAAAVSASLQAPAKTAVELNLRIRNTAVTEFATSPKRHHLVCFNSIAHIEQHADVSLATYS